ncbi:ribonuclease Rne/Rng family [Clostridium sp. CAG:571]|jgi:ribonuclease G|nr:ribonuclease Rne/Rng family [Clostridium sp. CAG:571]
MREIIIDNTDEKSIITLVENSIVTEKYEEDFNKKRIEGNIYLGKIQRVLPGLQAVFVDIGNNRNAFLHIKDIVPKVSNETGNKNKNFEDIDIKEYVKVGMPVIVQVKKDQIMQKGPRVSTHINMPGRFVVIMPGTKFITVSQKVENKEEINRLKEIVKKNLNKDLGIIIRTSAIGKNEKEIKEDMNEVIAKLEAVYSNLEKLENEKNFEPKLLYTNNRVIDRLLVDMMDRGINKIIVNTEYMYNYIENILKKMKQHDFIKIELKNNVFDVYDIKKQLEKIENRKIWLKCGGFITIDKTEALTAIDVNTGKYIGKKDLNDTIFTVNKEATIEIAKQLKLRDIGGIIIIDYIDMNEENRKKVLEIFKNCIKEDRSKVQIVGFTPLNLLELTRKHMWS